MTRFPTRGADFDASKALLGAAGGLAAGIPMGIVLHVGTGIMPVIGGVVGDPSAVVGWIVHLVLAAGGGVSFAIFVSLPVFHEITRSVAGCVIIGILQAFGFAAIMVGFVLPFLVDLTGAERAELAFPFGPVPGPALDALIGATVFGLAHILYGVVLGMIYAYGHGVRSDELSPTEDPSERTTGRGDP